jgi:hypothetical protein
MTPQGVGALVYAVGVGISIIGWTGLHRKIPRPMTLAVLCILPVMTLGRWLWSEAFHRWVDRMLQPHTSKGWRRR